MISKKFERCKTQDVEIVSMKRRVDKRDKC